MLTKILKYIQYTKMHNKWKTQDPEASRATAPVHHSSHAVPTTQYQSHRRPTTWVFLLYFSILKYYFLRFNIWITTDVGRCRELQRNHVWCGAVHMLTLNKHERKHQCHLLARQKYRFGILNSLAQILPY